MDSRTETLSIERVAEPTAVLAVRTDLPRIPAQDELRERALRRYRDIHATA